MAATRFVVGCFIWTALAATPLFAQRPPERRERTEREATAERARTESRERRTKSADKWDSNQQKDGFNRASRGETQNTGTAERERAERDAARARATERRADKADKWAPNQRRDQFNEAARQKESSQGTTGDANRSAAGSGNTGRTGGSPPPAAAPAPKPRGPG